MPKSRTGMTLIELLVVIAIIGVLMALSLPAIQRFRETANLTSCRNNLHQMGLALHSYHESVGHLPPAFKFDDTRGDRLIIGEWQEYEYSQASRWEPMLTFPGWGWAALLLPYIEQGALAQQFHYDRAVEHPLNAQGRTRVVKMYACPSDQHTGVYIVKSQLNRPLGEYATNSYAACYGTGGSIGELPAKGDGLFYRNSKWKLTDIPDGVFATLAVGERGAMLCQASWVGAISEGTVRTHPNAPVYVAAIEEPSTAVMARTGWYPLNSHYTEVYDFFSPHPGAGNFLFADGSVRAMSVTTPLEIWKAVGTRAGGEAVASTAH